MINHAMTERAALETQNLTMEFGGLKAVCDLSLEVPERSIFGLIGPNGAGKTTVFNMLTGVYRPTAGSIKAFEKSLVGSKPYRISALGVSRTFQNIRLFKNLSALENVLIALDHNPSFKKPSLFSSVFRTRSFIESEKAKIAEAEKLLSVLGLQGRGELTARGLPYGDQRRLEIARALATGAGLILLDEPAAGMGDAETHSLMQTIRFIRDELGITIILIEHDMKLVMETCERIAVLDYGRKIAEGTPQEVQSDEKVLEAYLGKRKPA